jgi:hypothetical protein
MSEESYSQPDNQNEPPRGSVLAQVAIAIFMGIPMTVALGIALVLYFAYEFVKFRIVGKPRIQPKQSPAEVFSREPF